MAGLLVNQYVLLLYLTRLGGNMFVVAIIFGATHSIGTFAFGVVMAKISDLATFRIVYLMIIVSSIFLIFFPDSHDAVAYFANCLYIASLSGWQNLSFLMTELRAPPRSLGAVNAISFTFANIVATLCPYIEQLDGVKPLIVCFIVSTVTTITTHFLPAPGAYLPKTKSEGQS